MTAEAYGASGPDIENLRRLVAVRCPSVVFGGWTVAGAIRGECSFRPPDNARPVLVQTPITPGGKQRVGLGLWRYRLAPRARNPPDPWRYARHAESVANWICDLKREA